MGCSKALQTPKVLMIAATSRLSTQLKHRTSPRKSTQREHEVLMTPSGHAYHILVVQRCPISQDTAQGTLKAPPISKSPAPATTTIVSNSSTLDEALPTIPAAAHSSEALAEVAQVVCAAEASFYRSRWLHRSHILPALHFWFGILRIGLAGFFRVFDLRSRGILDGLLFDISLGCLMRVQR